MTQAAGMYNTLLEINNPAIVIEPLKAYENKEYFPENLGEFKIPLGIPEIVEGIDQKNAKDDYFLRFIGDYRKQVTEYGYCQGGLPDNIQPDESA